MKWINNFEPLKIKQVNDKDVEIKKYCEDVWIIKEENREYLMIKRNFKNNFKRNLENCRNYCCRNSSYNSCDFYNYIN